MSEQALSEQTLQPGLSQTRDAARHLAHCSDARITAMLKNCQTVP